MEINDQNFEAEVEKFNGVVLVDFFATWCGPCQIQGPIVEDLAKEYAGNPNVKIFKMDVDQNQVTAGKYEIMSIPTLILFKDGKGTDYMNGLQNKAFLKEKIESLL